MKIYQDLLEETQRQHQTLLAAALQSTQLKGLTAGARSQATARTQGPRAVVKAGAFLIGKGTPTQRYIDIIQF